MKKLYPISLAVTLILAVFFSGCGGDNTTDGPNPTINAIHVKKDSPNPDGKGLTWNTAFHTIQGALEAAHSGEQIWVAVGTYFERITLKDGVVLYGGFTGSETIVTQRNWRTQVTILDGQKGGPVVTADNLTSAVNRIDGFTIKNGLNNYGGGIFCQGSVLTINNNTIIGNSANTYGGGIYCNNSTSVISNNIIQENTVGNNGLGGGIYNHSSSIIINNLISHNTANTVNGRGGGVYSSGSAKIINNTVVGNYALLYGGGIYILDGNPVISNNIIISNDHNGIFAYSFGPTLSHNCVFGNLSGNYLDVSPGSGDINVDPKFVDYNNFGLQTGSPCIDAGDDSVSGVGEVDLDGNPRRVGTHIDIGAYEWQGH